jgi:hypothetical protein
MVPYPATPLSGYLFCCGNNFDEQTGNCSESTREVGRKPFSIAPSVVIFNRSTGSTTSTEVKSGDAPIIVTHATSIKRDLIIGLGVGVPLLLAMFTALAMLRKERRRRKNLGTALDAETRKPKTVLVSMGKQRMYECEGTPVVKELPASYVQELGQGGFEVI